MALLQTLKFIVEHPLTRDQKITAMWRFVRWQVCSRLVRGAIEYSWIDGAKFLVKNGDTGFTGNIYTGLHEFSDMGFLLHFLRAEDLFVDVGANLGSYTVLASAVVRSRTYAFEPVAKTHARLTENLKLNDIEQTVVCVNAGLGDQAGQIAFTADTDTTNHALAPGEHCDNIVNVKLTTLDNALDGESPSLIKIDVEGYETAVLGGAGQVLENQSLKAVIMELDGAGRRYGYDESIILKVMIDHGFNSYCYDPLTRKLTELTGKNTTSGNTLFIRDMAFVAERLTTAPILFVHGRQF